MLSTERRKWILDEITRTGQLVTSQAASQLGVSEVTIRSDLDDLARRGRITRTHGGAVIPETRTGVFDFEARMLLNTEAKRQIALAAQPYVHSNQTVIFDAGSTVLHLAQVMPDVRDLTVYTPGITTARQLLALEGIDVRLLGGRLDPRRLETVGSPDEQGIKDVLAHTLFMGIQGIDSDLDMVEQSRDVAAGKLHYMRRARTVVLLIDSSKWNHAALAKVASVNELDIVITDSGIDESVRQRVSELDLDLVIA